MIWVLHFNLMLRSALLVMLCLALSEHEVPSRFLSWSWIAVVWGVAFFVDVANALVSRGQA